MNYVAVQNLILQKLRRELPERYLFHNWYHVWMVIRAATSLAERQQCPAETMVLLKTAALFHDCGYLEQYRNNEAIGAKMARETLPAYGYSSDAIKLIERLILATAFPYHPEDELEAILCDADLYYILTKLFYPRAAMLRYELAEVGMRFGDTEWLRMEHDFLAQLTFFTPWCREQYQMVKGKLMVQVALELRNIS